MYDYDDDYDDDYVAPPKTKAKAKPAAAGGAKQVNTEKKQSQAKPSKATTTTAAAAAATKQQAPIATAPANKSATSSTGISSIPTKNISESTSASTSSPTIATGSLENLSDDESDTLPASAVSGDSIPKISIVITGHVDAGKSTMLGNLLVQLGSVAKRTVQKYQKESEQVGKGSFALAWVMDESQSERAHGVTIDLAER